MQKLGVSNSPTLGSKESTPNQIRTRHLPRDFYNRHVRQPSRVPEDSDGLCDMYDRIIPEDAGYTDAMREAADMAASMRSTYQSRQQQQEEFATTRVSDLTRVMKQLHKLR